MCARLICGLRVGDGSVSRFAQRAGRARRRTPAWPVSSALRAVRQRFRQHGQMDTAQVEALHDLLAPTGWLDRTRFFARALRTRARTPHGLLIVGTPADEPWHMTAHLADESRLTGLPELAPVLVRWAPPPGSPPHLSIGIDRLQAVARDETLLVVSPVAAPASLLERLDDARKTGATIFALDQEDPELDALAHESLPVPPATAPLSF